MSNIPDANFCPHCRCSDVVIRKRRKVFKSYYLECQRCGWTSKSARTTGKAIENWNRFIYEPRR